MSDDEALQPLQRLHQLAREIRNALAQDNLEIVGQAAELLAPTLALWQEIQAEMPINAGEAAQLALDTRAILTECEESLLRAMGNIQAEMRRLRQGKRTLTSTQSVAIVGQSVDTLR
jgi:hypothetical protein